MNLKKPPDVKHVIMSRFRSRQKFHWSASPGRAPMEVDAFWHGKMGKRDEGTGKDKRGKRKRQEEEQES